MSGESDANLRIMRVESRWKSTSYETLSDESVAWYCHTKVLYSVRASLSGAEPTSSSSEIHGLDKV